ncbi:MAG TPA: threonine ammonia-lyase [Burkholderiaceae bacterium]|nr:threonine ammonia-lyase [Burkholderiaceae bacterium]HQR69709.1 threonine ammonia-lyase [Burkholderiaceae bacterium]
MTTATTGSPSSADPAAVSIDSIRAAAQRLRGHVEETPCVHSRTLSQITGAEIYLKFENLQFTASFKERGALNKLSRLTPEQRASGVIAVSAGNHAQGVAYHAQRLGIPAVIVMPRFTPTVKVERTRGFGAEIILTGDTFDDARKEAAILAARRGLTMVHPYDDADVIAGQGTIALEMLEQQPQLDCLCVAIGGGGLISGVATAVRALKPGVSIIGVQTDQFPSMYSAVKGVELPTANATLAEGIAVKQPGDLTLAIVRRLVDDIVLVSEGDIEQAIVMLLEIEKTVVEGAGATGLAAVMRHRERFAGRKVGLILCGGNIDPMVLADIIERGMVRAGRLARIRVHTRDVPGELARAATLIGQAGANIEEVEHQRAFTTLPVQNAELEFVLQTRGPEHIDEVIRTLRDAGLFATRHPY